MGYIQVIVNILFTKIRNVQGEKLFTLQELKSCNVETE